jgi:hypothetical protein
MTKDKSPPPDHLEWVIKGRAKNQQAALALWELIGDPELQVTKKGLSSAAQDLAAVAFSLWRAVFLADRIGSTEAKMASVHVFLGKMLTDNAIAFTQDREAREWTFNYYLDNALYRLVNLEEKWPSLKKIPLEPPSGKRTSKRRWDYLQDALDAAILALDAEVRDKSSQNKKPSRPRARK